MAMHERIGHPELDRELLHNSSPLFFAKNIRVPMFIAQGGHLKLDLPQQIDEVRKLHPLVRFEQAAALGDAEPIIQAMVAHVLTLAGE